MRIIIKQKRPKNEVVKKGCKFFYEKKFLALYVFTGFPRQNPHSFLERETPSLPFYLKEKFR
jgi:hypothetical protein